MRLWIKNPLGIVAEAAGGGIVVDGAVPGLDVAALRLAHGAASRRYA